MKIAITGASGLIGSRLSEDLKQAGHQVQRIVRGNPRQADICWEPLKDKLDAKALEGLDAVIHLAGDNVGQGRWSPAKKQRILESRTHSTRLLAQTLARLSQPPQVLISASAAGYYGSDHQPAVSLNESSPPGQDFLAQVCQQWEAAADPAREAGIRVIHPRFGMVLSKTGGALAKMLPAFQLGLGGPVGDGRQIMSWIDLDDVTAALQHCLAHEALSGPVNLVSPQPVSNQLFTQTLGQVLGRPTIFAIPELAIQLLFGEMGETLLLGSSNISPRRLLETGYQFQYPSLKQSLKHVLGKA